MSESRETFFRQGSWMLTATFIGGVLMFAVHLFGGWMNRGEYGLFVTLLQVLNLMMIPALGLQTVFAQRTAAASSDDEKSNLAASIRKIFLICFIGWLTAGGVALLLESPILKALKAGDPLPIYLTILIGLPQLCLPMLLGILQGRQMFGWLGWAAIANGAGRFSAVGLLVTVFSWQAVGAVAGVLIGLTVSCLLAGWHGRQVWAKSLTLSGQFHTNEWLRHIVPLTLGLGASQVMLSADMIAARNILSAADSGTYGAAGMFGRGLVIFTAPLAAVMFPKMVNALGDSKKTVLGQAIKGTILLGLLCCVGCSLTAWYLPDLSEKIESLAAKQKVISEIGALLPFFVWGMLPLALANVYVVALLAKEQYRGVHMLVAVAVVYAVALLWLAIKPEPPNQQTIVLTLGGFNLIYLGVANRLANRLAI